jgi:hypothetical protein
MSTMSSWNRRTLWEIRGRASLVINWSDYAPPAIPRKPSQATSDARRALFPPAEAPRRPADDIYRGVLSITPGIKRTRLPISTPVFLRHKVGPSIGPECSEIRRFLPPHPQNQISTGWNTQADVRYRNRKGTGGFICWLPDPSFQSCGYVERGILFFSAPVMKGDWYLAGVRCLVPGSFSSTRPTLDFYRNLNCRYFLREFDWVLVRVRSVNFLFTFTF